MGRIQKLLWLAAAVVLALGLTACDVEKQMDTMVDNPSFAEPLFAKFMAKSEYQVKAMDTILADAALRQMLLEKIAADADYAQAAAEQLVASPENREMIGQLLTNPPAEEAPAEGT